MKQGRGGREGFDGTMAKPVTDTTTTSVVHAPFMRPRVWFLALCRRDGRWCSKVDESKERVVELELVNE